MNTTETLIPRRPKFVTKDWLENQIKELNQWLFDYGPYERAERRQKEHDRNYYVRKLIELEENKFNMIEV